MHRAIIAVFSFTHYTAFNPTIAQSTTIVTLRCASYMFRPQHGHPQEDLQQRNTIMVDPVKCVRIWSQNTMFAINIAKIIYNIQYM